MTIGGSQANDAFLRVPVQARILADAGPAATGDRGAPPSDGPAGARRSDSLRTVSGTRIDRPVAGGRIARPTEGAPQMEEAETPFPALMDRMRGAATAQDTVRLAHR